MRFGSTSLAMPALALAAAAGVAVAQIQPISGPLTVLTMNVAGLPAILQNNEVPGDKTTNTRTIGSKMAQYGYDIIHVQEDFNYHADLYATDNHPFRSATSGGVPFGSGLNTLANYDWVDYDRVKWNTCSNASGNDCLTPKGYTFMRMRVAEGIYIDVYNLHTDAGTEPGDLTARNANLRQVSDAITAYSGGNAVIVMGDTNSRYTRTQDGITIFRTANGMKDAWVEQQRGGVEPTVETTCSNPSLVNDCETVDKIFFRSGPTVGLRLLDQRFDSTNFLQADGNILSDHNPIWAKFQWSGGVSMRQSDLFGGPHGTYFSDAPALSAKAGKVKPAVLRFYGGSRLDSVAITLADGTELSHGGLGGSLSYLALGANEFWTKATMCSGQKSGKTRVFYIKATTSTGRTVQAGSTTDNCQDFTAPNGWQIVGMSGSSGDEMDRISFLYMSQ